MRVIGVVCVCAAMAIEAAAGTLVVLNKSDDTASVIDSSTGETAWTVRVGNAPHEAAASPDGRTVVVCNYGDRRERGSTLSVFRLDERGPARTIDLVEYHRPHGIVFFADGERVLVTAEVEKKILVVNIVTGAVERAIDTGQGGSHMVAMNSEETHAVTANLRDGSATIIDLRSGEITAVLPTGAQAEGVAFRPGTGEVWVSNREADTVSVVDLATARVVAEFDCAEFPIRVAFTPDGARGLVSCAESGDLAVVDADTRRLVARVSMTSASVEGRERDERLFGSRFGGSPTPVGVLVEPGGERAYVANTNADVVTVINLRELAIEGRLVAGSEPDGMAWSALAPAP